MRIFYLLLITLILGNNNTFLLDSSSTKIVQKNIISLDSANTFQDTIKTKNIQTEVKIDTLKKIVNLSISEYENDIFYEQLLESKLAFADAIMYDATLDTVEASIQFQALFESFEFLNSLSLDDEYKRMEYNMLLNASIDYYQKKSVTVNKLESPLSMALFKEELDQFFYKQELEDVEFVDETVEFIDGHIPITFNSKVHKNVKYFSSAQAKKGVQLWLNRMEKFRVIMLPILEEEGIPLEAFYVAVIESGLNPLALSYAQASGPWQFIASTGRIYELNKNWYIDERRDFVKSTYAAAKYLKDLKNQFDTVNPDDENGENWYLAFAAYNCGATRVLKEMKRSNSNNFWDLNRLPGQTRNYVPKILAIFMIAQDPEKYGFNVVPEPNMDWIVKNIDKQISFDQISEISGVDIKILQEYNPEIKRGILPPLEKGQVYDLRLPNNHYENFDSLYTLLKKQDVKDLLVIEYTVKRGDNLSKIASRYKVKIRDITSMNNISTKKYLQPGQKLQIPTQGYDEYMQSILTSDKTKKIFYTVESGDTLSEIAIKYRTSVKKIKAWNGMRTDVIYAGKKLTIHISSSDHVPVKQNQYTERKIVYKVKKGDSLSRISKKYRVPIYKIKKWNNLDTNIIRINQKLIIYTKY